MIRNALLSCFIFSNGIAVIQASDALQPSTDLVDNSSGPAVGPDQAQVTVENAPSVQSEVESPSTSTAPVDEEYCDEVKIAAKSHPNSFWKFLGLTKRQHLLFCSTKSGMMRIYTPDKEKLLMEQQFTFLEEKKAPLSRVAQLRAALHI